MDVNQIMIYEYGQAEPSKTIRLPHDVAVGQGLLDMATGVKVELREAHAAGGPRVLDITLPIRAAKQEQSQEDRLAEMMAAPAPDPNWMPEIESGQMVRCSACGDTGFAYVSQIDVDSFVEHVPTGTRGFVEFVMFNRLSAPCVGIRPVTQAGLHRGGGVDVFTVYQDDCIILDPKCDERGHRIGALAESGDIGPIPERDEDAIPALDLAPKPTTKH